MVEMIGLVVISALVWVLAWAMGAEKSEAERKAGYSIPQPLVGGKDRSEQPVRHAA